MVHEKSKFQKINDRVEGKKIILHADGSYPKEVIIVSKNEILKYQLTKSKNGRYQLNK